ncbi:MAG: ATP-binding cassette domain-containing protein, partial [Pseudomonadota bacterium]|nr:ATP-binding cassette domain-containing protein [Pseudomonadota bacterium]
LLSAGDWLGRSFHSQPALNKAVQGHKVLNALPASSLATLSLSTSTGSVVLAGFGSVNVPEQAISAELPERGLVWVTGPSGKGKSQLLQAIAGLEASRGSRAYAGQVLSPGLVSGWLYLEQQPLVMAATLKHNLCLGQSFRHTELEHALVTVGLSYLSEPGEWLGPGGRQLSGGERKRLNIARALLHGGPVWLVDEPFEGLDSEAASLIMSVLQTSAKDRLVVIASHVIPEHTRPALTLRL